jgi:hypothetical protein
MNENKISVSEFLETPELLEVGYTPYDKKVDIVDVILSQVIVNDEVEKIDSALLKRIKTQIFIESITNIDMSIESDDGLNGYDELCLLDELDMLIELIYDEYSRFEEILELKLQDFYRYKTSTSATMLSLKNNFLKFAKEKYDEISNMIDNIDTHALSDKLKVFINDNIEKYRGK